MAASDSTVKDLVAGTAGGIAQVLVGQPFDIVKVVCVRDFR
jgi:solute carrier family 25 carnitine/acylcarnitine transporter 20/29